MSALFVQIGHCFQKIDESVCGRRENYVFHFLAGREKFGGITVPSVGHEFVGNEIAVILGTYLFPLAVGADIEEGINLSLSVFFHFDSGHLHISVLQVGQPEADQFFQLAAIEAVNPQRIGKRKHFAHIDDRHVAFGKAGADASALLKSLSRIVGGGGGGRPDNASSGNGDPSKLGEAFAAIPEILKGQQK